jgi:hypothetical protein
MIHRAKHYCKHCDESFFIKIHPKETGDFFLVCPYCSWPHYRFFKDGLAMHCDIKQRLEDPIEIKGTKIIGIS